jgi:hypothetical protein
MPHGKQRGEYARKAGIELGENAGVISNQVLQRGSTLRESLLPEVFDVEMEQIKGEDPARQENFPAIAQSNWLKTSVFWVEVCREELSGAGPLITERQKCSAASNFQKGSVYCGLWW